MKLKNIIIITTILILFGCNLKKTNTVDLLIYPSSCGSEPTEGFHFKLKNDSLLVYLINTNQLYSKDKISLSQLNILKKLIIKSQNETNTKCRGVGALDTWIYKLEVENNDTKFFDEHCLSSLKLEEFVDSNVLIIEFLLKNCSQKIELRGFS